MPISSTSSVQSDPTRLAALRAILRDNTGAVSGIAKAEAFKALPNATGRLDIRV